MPARLSLFDEVVDTWHGESVLDLGCGGEFMAEALAQRGANVISVGPFVGLGPCGLNRRLDITFGRFPSVQIMYAGHARKD